MKTGYILAAAVTAALSISSCADLGFGVDVDSGSIGPYWNDYGPYGDHGILRTGITALCIMAQSTTVRSTGLR